MSLLSLDGLILNCTDRKWPIDKKPWDGLGGIPKLGISYCGEDRKCNQSEDHRKINANFRSRNREIEKSTCPVTASWCAITLAMSQPATAPTDRRRPLSVQLTIAVVGALMALIAHFALPKSPGQSFFHLVSNLQGNGWQFAWMHFVASYYTQVTVFLVMVLFAVYRRGPRAWIFAFLSGSAVPDLFIFHFLR